MKWFLQALVVAIAGCNAMHPVAENEPNGVPQDPVAEAKDSEPESSRELGDHLFTIASMNSVNSLEDETWGEPNRPAAPVTLGERVGQDPRDDLWEWIDCSRFYAKATLGGPNGTGWVVRTSSRSRYRIWSLNPLTVEVQIHGFVGEPSNRFEFFDAKGEQFVPTDKAYLQAPRVQGVETLHCDARKGSIQTGNWVERPIPPTRWIQRERGAGWVQCSALSLLTADRTRMAAHGDDPSSFRILHDDAVEWVTGAGFSKRGGLATQVSEVQCEGQKLPRMRRASSKKPRKDCVERTHNPSWKNWTRLPPAKVAASTDNCVGYCFRGFVDSLTRENPRVARVAVIGEQGTFGKATLRRTIKAEESDRAIDERRPLTFKCFEKSVGKGAVPHFDDCVQMESEPPDDWDCLTGVGTVAAQFPSRLQSPLD